MALRAAGSEPVVVQRVATVRGELVLRRDGAHYEVISNGIFLMDTRDGRSERLLVDAALARAPAARTMLVGGLGVGFTLARALSCPRIEQVTVVEIESALVDWHHGPLAAWSVRALDDGRVRVVVDDLLAVLDSDPATYDVVCLDIDNGPDWTVTPSNAGLYDDTGTARVVSRLRDGGVLSVWSAHRSPGYESVLRRHLDNVDVQRVPVARGEPDVVMTGTRPMSA